MPIADDPIPIPPPPGWQTRICLTVELRPPGGTGIILVTFQSLLTGELAHWLQLPFDNGGLARHTFRWPDFEAYDLSKFILLPPEDTVTAHVSGTWVFEEHVTLSRSTSVPPDGKQYFSGDVVLHKRPGRPGGL